MKGSPVFSTILLALAPSLAMCEVVDSSANGFTVRTTLTIQAGPDEVYRRLVHNVGDWWESAHTFSGDAHNLTIEDRPMGCFCEKLPNQGGVRHMEVVFAAPGKRLGMSGGLGPLQSIAAAGSMRIELSPVPTGTKLDLTYTVAGYLPKGMNTWAEPVDAVLAGQFTRLKTYVEHGAEGLRLPPPKQP
jgi:hypothetical protein